MSRLGDELAGLEYDFFALIENAIDRGKTIKQVQTAFNAALAEATDRPGPGRPKVTNISAREKRLLAEVFFVAVMNKKTISAAANQVMGVKRTDEETSVYAYSEARRLERKIHRAFSPEFSALAVSWLAAANKIVDMKRSGKVKRDAYLEAISEGVRLEHRLSKAFSPEPAISALAVSWLASGVSGNGKAAALITEFFMRRTKARSHTT